jgi:hypothetical protein
MSIPGNNIRGIVTPRGRKNIQCPQLKEGKEKDVWFRDILGLERSDALSEIVKIAHRERVIPVEK